ncbi:hypothetical protein YC2023_060716 [Brassica napus]
MGIYRRTVVVGIYRRTYIRRNLPTNAISVGIYRRTRFVGIFRRPLSVGKFRRLKFVGIHRGTLYVGIVRETFSWNVELGFSVRHPGQWFQVQIEALRKYGRWAFNADDVVLPSPSTSVEESLAYFISNGFDVWRELEIEIGIKILWLLHLEANLLTELYEADKKALVLIMKSAQIFDKIYCHSSLSQQFVTAIRIQKIGRRRMLMHQNWTE